MQILLLTGTDPYYNLAMEEYFLCNRTGEDYFILWRNENTIVVGVNQNTLEEINTDFVDAYKIRVARRRTGGGAVYHDLGNLNFSFITRIKDAAEMSMEFFTRPVIEALGAMGVKAAVSGRNDIEVDGRKISGNAQNLYKERILHHGTLLFDSDLTVLSRALKVKPEKFQSKSVKSVWSRVANIKDFLPQPMTMHEFSSALLQMFRQKTDSVEVLLSAEDDLAIKKLCAEKYGTWEWNYGHSPKFNLRNLEKYSGGVLEVVLNIEGGKITDCGFYGDFMALRPLDAVCSGLRGLNFERGRVAAYLDTLALGEYFGSITPNEILNCMFNPAR